MKRLIIPAILSLSTLASLVYKAPASAAINTHSEIDAITEITTVETENTSQSDLVEIESTAEEVAYNNCYIEYYYDGSYAWICW